MNQHRRQLSAIGAAGCREVNATAAQGCSRQAFGIAAEQNIDAAPGHVGGDSDGAGAPGLGDDLGFFFVLFGVEDFVLDAGFVEIAAEAFRCLNCDGADEDGLLMFVALFDRLDDGVPFRRFIDVDEVVLVIANHWHMVGIGTTSSS